MPLIGVSVAEMVESLHYLICERRNRVKDCSLALDSGIDSLATAAAISSADGGRGGGAGGFESYGSETPLLRGRSCRAWRRSERELRDSARYCFCHFFFLGGAEEVGV